MPSIKKDKFELANPPLEVEVAQAIKHSPDVIRNIIRRLAFDRDKYKDKTLTVAEARSQLTLSMSKDHNIAREWHSSIAIMANNVLIEHLNDMNREKIHELSNKVATKIMDVCFGVRTN